MPKNKVNNPNGKNGGKEHKDAIDLIFNEIKEENKDNKEVQVSKEKPIATYVAKDIRIADVASFILGAIGNVLQITWLRIIQVGRTNSSGKPVKREQEAIKDIEKATGIKVEFYDYKNKKFIK
ncbi:MAG: hypothetical protein MUE81_15770 [Thermoflexibacter sp.]|jgi:hypothetical protein|nr:hypothetical protein [Thermoflexibacter sp.]